jgi:hypothetical protein
LNCFFHDLSVLGLGVVELWLRVLIHQGWLII